MRRASVIGGSPAVLVAAAAVTLASAGQASAAVPSPVYGSAADPGVVRTTSSGFVVFATGSLAPMAQSGSELGPWVSGGKALSGLGTWSSGGAVWAPDAWKTPTGWVLYYSAPATGMNGQRCIGVATANDVMGPYTPEDIPLVCPNGALGADDQVPGQPVADAGVIDPSPFLASDGRRYLLYRTQMTPSSLRMVALESGGTHTISDSRELRQSSGNIENPVMVQRASSYVLFASRQGWNNCSYATAWFRSTGLWRFANQTEHTLLDTSGTGICGPGGADVVPGANGGTRIFLHGWRCDYPTGARNCASTADVDRFPHSRSMYVGVLGWGSDGATPKVTRFLD